MLEYIPLEEAQKIILDNAAIAGTEVVGLMDSVNRVLAEDIYAVVDQPPFDRSPLDGYAVRSSDTKAAAGDNPAGLRIAAEVAAGYMAEEPVAPGTAVKIMTGAPIPLGADAVIKFEDTEEEKGWVLIFAPVKENSNLVRAGEDVKKGEKLIEKGTVINYGEIGMMAAQGKAKVKVYKKPRVAVISTGDELADIGEPLGLGKIYNSNLYAVGAAVVESGGIPVLMGAVPDRVDESLEKLKEALFQADIVLTTGGVSVGDYDVVKDVFKGVGAELLFWRMAMKPGTPAVCARKGEKFLIGLSGNPAAALVTYELLVRPLLYKSGGRKNYMPEKITAEMNDDFSKISGQRRFLRANVFFRAGTAVAALTGRQNPGVMRSVMGCNALIDLRPGGALAKGDRADVILLDGLGF